MRLGLVLLGETAHVSRLKRAWSRPLRAWCEHHAGMMMSPALSCAPLFFSPSVDSALCSRSRRLLVMRSVMGGMSQLHVPARRDGGWVVGGVEHVKGETRGLRFSLCSLEGRVEEERGKEGKPCRAPEVLNLVVDSNWPIDGGVFVSAARPRCSVAHPRVIFLGFCFERRLDEMTMDARHGGPARCLCQDIERQHPSDHSQFTFSSRLSVCQAILVMCRDVTSSLPGPLNHNTTHEQRPRHADMSDMSLDYLV